jgi:hypothetical protein
MLTIPGHGRFMHSYNIVMVLDVRAMGLNLVRKFLHGLSHGIHQILRVPVTPIPDLDILKPMPMLTLPTGVIPSQFFFL